MRIISGKYKSRRIIAPSKLPVRPTTDMAKEALFNILNNQYYFDEIVFLDLFSGTGNISYEFASRGCENITAIDENYGCVQFINKTATELQFDITVLKSDVFSFLEKTVLKSDVIFADPPYNMGLEDFEKMVKLVFENELLLENGILIIEHAKKTNLEHLSNFKSKRKYGGNVFSFFELA